MQPIEIRFNRYSYLIPVPFALLLMWVFYEFVLNEPQEHLEDDKTFYYIAIGVIVLGSFLVLNFLWRFIKAPVVFRMDDEGILYNPAGVSTGLIRWDEISDVNETNMKVVRGDAPVYQTVLAVKIKDPKEFRKRYNIGLRPLLKLGDKMYGGDVMIESKILGKYYEAVKAEIRRRVPLSFQNLSSNPASKIDI